MKYLLAVLCFSLLSEYINASATERPRNVMSRGRGIVTPARTVNSAVPDSDDVVHGSQQTSGRGGGYHSGSGHFQNGRRIFYPQENNYTESYYGRQNYHTPPTYFGFQQMVFQQISSQTYESWCLLQTVQGRVSEIQQNPAFYGTKAQWQGLHTQHNPYQLTSMVRNSILTVAQNLSLNNWHELMLLIAESIRLVDSAIINTQTDWSLVRLHLVNAQDFLRDSLGSIIASFDADQDTGSSTYQEPDSDGINTSMPDTTICQGSATPLSSVKSVVSTKDVEVQTEEQAIPKTTSADGVLPDSLPSTNVHQILPAVDIVVNATAVLHKVVVEVKDEGELQIPVVATGSQSRKKTKSQENKWQVVHARTQTATALATLKPIGGVATELKATKEKKPLPKLTAEEQKQQDDKRKKAVAAKTEKEKQEQEESERQKAAALAKVLQEVQANSAKIKAASTQVNDSIAQCRKLLAEAINEPQKAQLRKKITEFGELLRKLSATQKAISSAASKSAKELHEMKKNTNVLLGEISDDEEDIKAFLSAMATDIAADKAHEKQLELLKPFMPNLQRMVDDLSRLQNVCDYVPPQEFFKLEPSSTSPYQLALNGLKVNLQQFLKMKDRIVPGIAQLMSLIEESSSLKYTEYYNGQLSLFADSENYCSHTMRSAENYREERKVYPTFLQNDRGQIIAFPGVQHYQTTLAMLAAKRQSLETSHAEWSRYSASMVQLLQSMKEELEQKSVAST